MKEQIEEMVKSFIDGKDVPSGADCRLCLFDRDTLYIKVAEALYNAGYRKQKEGEWEFVEEEDFIYCICRCSSCGKEFFFDADETGYNFCPNCGAKMKGGAE